MRQRAAVLVMVVGLLLVSAGNASAAGWIPQVNASWAVPSAEKFEVVSLQDVAVDGEGNATAVWIQSTMDGPQVVEAATRPVGGSWSEPVELSGDSSKVDLHLAVNPEGDAAVLWVAYGGGKQIVRAVTRPAGGEWSDPVTITGTEEEAYEPDLAIDEQGTATAIWAGNVGWEEGVIEATAHPVGGEWSEPVELSDGSRAARAPKVAVDAQGEATAVWVLNTGSRDDGVIQSATRPAGAEWSEPVDVSGEDGLASAPRVAVGPEGDATVLWQQQDIPAPSGFRIFVQTAHRVDGTWSDPLSLTREDWISTNPELTVDQQGNVTAIWTGGEPGTATRHLTVRGRDAAGTWGAPYDLVTKSGFSEPGEGNFGLGTDAAGNVTAIWTAWAATTEVVRTARLPVGGAWSAPETLSSTSGYSLWPRLAVDPTGYATAIWSGYQGGAQAVRSRVFDPIAPELRDIAVPATGTVGQPVAMSVDPFDAWPPVTSSWDFGDGGKRNGAAVTHCFSSPGEYQVTVTGTDRAANATSASRTIEIEPDPAVAAGTDPCAEEPQPPVDPGPNDPDPPTNPGSGNPGGRTDPGPRPGPSAPVLSDLRQDNPRWRTPGTAGRSRLPVATTFRFTLDRPAQVRLAFSRTVAGRRQGGRCVKPTRANAGAARCTRSQARGTLAFAGAAGESAYGFRGSVGVRTLEPGRYRLLATAAADGMTSAVASLEFTIVR